MGPRGVRSLISPHRLRQIDNNASSTSTPPNRYCPSSLEMTSPVSAQGDKASHHVCVHGWHVRNVRWHVGWHVCGHIGGHVRGHVGHVTWLGHVDHVSKASESCHYIMITWLLTHCSINYYALLTNYWGVSCSSKSRIEFSNTKHSSKILLLHSHSLLCPAVCQDGLWSASRPTPWPHGTHTCQAAATALTGIGITCLTALFSHSASAVAWPVSRYIVHSLVAITLLSRACKKVH